MPATRNWSRRYIPDLADAVYFGHPGNEGEALFWGEQLGAELRDMTGHQGHGSVAHPQGILVSWAVIMEGGFQVNCHGVRFWDESSGYSEAGVAVMGQPGSIAWDIFDSRIAGIARQFEDFRQAEAQGAVLTADSIEELARLTENAAGRCHGAGFRVEGRRYHRRIWSQLVRCCSPGAALFRRTRHRALFHSQGGLAVDDQARVRLAAGGVIENLFAAGGAACGVSGPDASGYLSGNGLLSAVTLGRIAGEEAAARVRK